MKAFKSNTLKWQSLIIGVVLLFLFCYCKSPTELKSVGGPLRSICEKSYVASEIWNADIYGTLITEYLCQGQPRENKQLLKDK
jgi:hypothetical protein